jgi:hypothetical protein
MSNFTNLTVFTEKYNCAVCNIKCTRESEWSRHILTRKHIRKSGGNNESKQHFTQNIFTCNKCYKEYKSYKGLWGHKKLCNIEVLPDNIVIPNKPENVVVQQDSSNNEVIQLLIKENTDFKTMLMEMMKNTTDLVKNNTDLQRQMLELCKNHTTINATNNNINDNSNKTFNLQVFLNENCKNAMNLDDFANSIQLKLSDLIRVGEEGYVPGMSKVIIERLSDIKECDRPIHCSDEKREAVQVKMADKWEREAIDSVNLTNAVRIIEQKQFDMLTTFRDTYPECMNSESHHNDMLIKLFQNLSNSKQPEFIKVLKKVAKSVVIDKEKYLKAA